MRPSVASAAPNNRRGVGMLARARQVSSPSGLAGLVSPPTVRVIGVLAGRPPLCSVSVIALVAATLVAVTPPGHPETVGADTPNDDPKSSMTWPVAGTATPGVKLTDAVLGRPG